MENKIEEQLRISVRLQMMETHEIMAVTDVPYFRVMRVESGWLYNFYDSGIDDYTSNWIFVPQNKLD